ncbi:MAG: molybdopterin-dependent oxidoreductase [Adlercreutzia sp.]|nr:molybdopterin-dependent oxidoreductase [Adlercreutzia sp.]
MVGAGALGSLGVSSMLTAEEWFGKAHAEAPETIARTYHQSHCGGMCSLTCTVRDGRLVKVEPNGVGNPDFKTVCLKGISEVAHIYGKGRIQTPLKRVGERGSGDFEPVSWDEALDEIVGRIQEVQGTYGKDALLVMKTAEADFGFLGPMLGAQGGGLDGIDVGTGNGLDPAMGFGGGYAMCAPEARDWQRSKLVLTVGSNYCESSLPNVFTFLDAKEAGAHMVTVDPHYSTTACKSDEWIPIEPGTDAALFLGMTSYILENDLIDEDFIVNHTSLPFLVNRETGLLARDHGEGAIEVSQADFASDPAAGAGQTDAPGTEGNPANEEAAGEAAEPETAEQNPFFMLDASGNVARFDQCDAPLLDGGITINGVEYVTAYRLLLETQEPFTTAWAADVTGVDQSRIEELAAEYAEGPSSLCLGWGGNDKMTNADIAGHAAAVLVAVTGNVGKPGAGVGVYVGQSYNSYAAALGGWAMPEDWAMADSPVNFYDLPFKENNVHGAIFCGDFVAQHAANMNETTRWVSTLDLVVSIDPYFTEGAKWSDYILPCTSRFEYDEPFGNVSNGYSQIVIQEKVIDPLFEAKTDLWIQREIARRLGLEAGLPASSVDRCNAILSTSPEPWVAELTVEKIAENGAVWPVPDRETIREVVADRIFPTTSGRMEVYYDNLATFAQALPQWEACTEIADETLRAQFPLQLSNTRTRFRIHNQFYDADWLQLFYEPTIMVNPAELQSRGLQTGDAVRVFNDRGSFSVRVAGNAAIRPGSARIYEAATALYDLEGNLQSTTNDTMIERGSALMCGPVIPFSDTLVQIEKA